MFFGRSPVGFGESMYSAVAGSERELSVLGFTLASQRRASGPNLAVRTSLSSSAWSRFRFGEIDYFEEIQRKSVV